MKKKILLIILFMSFVFVGRVNAEIECHVEYPKGVVLIAFETNGGNEIEEYRLAVLPNQSKTLPTPTREGYIFEGWYYDPEFNEKVNTTEAYDIPIHTEEGTYNGCKTTIPRTRLYAKWSKVTEYECHVVYPKGTRLIAFETNGGNEIEEYRLAVLPNQSKTLPTPTREGYIFEGWYYDSEFSEKVNTTEAYEVQGRTEEGLYEGCKTTIPRTRLYAKWSKVTEYECHVVYPKGTRLIAFETNGGNEIEEYRLAVLPNQSKTLPTPTRKGYIFEGWYYDSEFSEKVNTTEAYEVQGRTEEGLYEGCKTTIPRTRLYAKWSIEKKQIEKGNIKINISSDTPVEKIDVTEVNEKINSTEDVNQYKTYKVTAYDKNNKQVDFNSFGTIWFAIPKNYDASKVEIRLLKDGNEKVFIPLTGAQGDQWFAQIITDELGTFAIAERKNKDIEEDVKMSEEWSSDTIRRFVSTFAAIEGSKQSLLQVKQISVSKTTQKIESSQIDGTINKQVSYDIDLIDSNGKKVQPGEKVKIYLKLPEGFDQKKIQVYRNEGNELVRYNFTIEGDNIVVETDHFSVYTIAEVETTPTKNPNSGNFVYGIIITLSIGIITLILLYKFVFKNRVYRV